MERTSEKVVFALFLIQYSQKSDSETSDTQNDLQTSLSVISECSSLQVGA